MELELELVKKFSFDIKQEILKHTNFETCVLAGKYHWNIAKRFYDPDTYTLYSIAYNRKNYLLEWIHENNPEVFSEKSMDTAAFAGNFEMVKWLHAKGYTCTAAAIDSTCLNSHMDIIKWLSLHRSEGCTPKAIDNASYAGNLELVKWLDKYHDKGCTRNALINAAGNGHKSLINWLYGNKKYKHLFSYRNVGDAIDEADFFQRHDAVKFIKNNIKPVDKHYYM